MSAVESSRGRDAFAGLTLHAILLAEKQQAASAAAHVNRTLLDIIRADEPPLHPHNPTTTTNNNKDRKSWKAFRYLLRLKRTASVLTPSLHSPPSDVITTSISRREFNHLGRSCTFPSVGNDASHGSDSVHLSGSSRQTNPRNSTPFGLLVPIQVQRMENSMILRLEVDEEEMVGEHEGMRCLANVLAEERALSVRERAAATATEEERQSADASLESEGAQPVRMSLMDLLEETDRRIGTVGFRYVIGADMSEGGHGATYGIDLEGLDGGVEEEPSGGGVEHKCCVCMVRQKGAAFIPCGHTFCRLCSRELWVQRGHCPVCNTSILEILDIF